MLDPRLKRASIAEIGGFRPPEDPLASDPDDVYDIVKGSPFAAASGNGEWLLRVPDISGVQGELGLG